MFTQLGLTAGKLHRDNLNNKESVTGERPSPTLLKRRARLGDFQEGEYSSFLCSLPGLCKGKVNVLII